MNSKHFTPMAPNGSITERDILHGLSEIAEYLRYMAGGDELPPIECVNFAPSYSDGTPKPYSTDDTHCAKVRKAQAAWEWDD